MRLSDIEKLMEDDRRNPTKDVLDRANYSDTRKPKITLSVLNQLKKMRISKHNEMKKKNALVGIMYSGGKDEDDSV